jgi:hypothetical protein
LNAFSLLDVDTELSSRGLEALGEPPKNPEMRHSYPRGCGLEGERQSEREKKASSARRKSTVWYENDFFLLSRMPAVLGPVRGHLFQNNCMVPRSLSFPRTYRLLVIASGTREGGEGREDYSEREKQPEFPKTHMHYLTG